MIRVFADIKEMAGWITYFDGGTAAQLIDPLIRPTLAKRYKELESAIEEVKKARAAAHQTEEAVKQKLGQTGKRRPTG